MPVHTETYLALLHRLTDRLGVERTYTDVFGDTHTADPQTLETLLTTLGFESGSEEKVQASLRALDDRDWSRAVPTVTVLRDNLPQTIAVCLPVTALDGQLTWVITLEDGSIRTGSVAAETLTVIERREDDPSGPQVRLPLALPEDLPPGYHSIAVTAGMIAGQGTLIATPAASWLPPHLENGERVWGMACQLYSLRSDANWGMGDFADLADVCRKTAALGGDLVGINPVHSTFLARPNDVSPYSPCSRLFISPLYISVEDVPELADCADAKACIADPEIRGRLAVTRSAEFVDYPAVSTLKLEVLEHLFETFEAAPRAERTAAFDRFVTDGGERLTLWAIYQVLSQVHDGAAWRAWPAEFHDPRSAAVARFATAQAKPVRFFLWLQFEADRQMAAAAEALREAGGRIGLYRDLAVGANPDGADAWTDQNAYVTTARFGAPPDALGPLGQDWGLPPPNPLALQDDAYGPYIAMLRANMRHAGALRIDHAMALQHLFWIPPGLTATHGLYVGYPMSDLLGILALESHRNRCMVIGEDLGTVPDGFRAQMSRENVLSYRLLYFERWKSGLFMRPDTYPRLALATATSHDLATIAGNWTAWDVALRHRLHLTREASTEEQDLAARAVERSQLHDALLDQSLLPDTFPKDPDLTAEQMDQLIEACHRYLARSPALLMVVNIDDLAATISQVNVPGTVNEYPNWRRRLRPSVAEILGGAKAEALARVLRAERAN